MLPDNDIAIFECKKVYPVGLLYCSVFKCARPQVQRSYTGKTSAE